jgi:hypothetical protein
MSESPPPSESPAWETLIRSTEAYGRSKNGVPMTKAGLTALDEVIPDVVEAARLEQVAMSPREDIHTF